MRHKLYPPFDHTFVNPDLMSNDDYREALLLGITEIAKANPDRIKPWIEKPEPKRRNLTKKDKL